jgi:hypothetical protein
MKVYQLDEWKDVLTQLEAQLRRELTAAERVWAWCVWHNLHRLRAYERIPKPKEPG